jgi:radical SAM superfamily enzyme YgiQ (UPF0313 family)
MACYAQGGKSEKGGKGSKDSSQIAGWRIMRKQAKGQFKIVLINPWIYDFAAVNLWARPLGLLKVAESLSRFDISFVLIDCMDAYEKRKRYSTGKFPRKIVPKPEMLRDFPRNYARYGISSEEFRQRLEAALPADAVLVTSIMTYWYPGVRDAVGIVKSMAPGLPVILGGIYASLYSRHAADFSGADHIFPGHGDHRISAVLNRSGSGHYGIEAILRQIGIKLRETNPARPYYKLSLYDSYPFAPVLTGMGCPFRCHYCASSILSPGFFRYDIDELVNEITELHSLGVRDFAFYDDALLVDPDRHIKVILRKVIKRRLNVRFHCPNGLHASFIDEELAQLMHRSGFRTLRLSLETVDEGRQGLSSGKVDIERFRKAVEALKKAGFTKDQIGTYLMYGLPGQPIEEVRDGIEFLMALGVRINLTEFSPIPGTACWDMLVKAGTIHRDIDPLLTNNSVFSVLFGGYDIREIERIKILVNNYNSSRNS